MSAARLRDLHALLFAALVAAGLLISALFTAKLVQVQPLLALGVPGAAVAAILFARWPALGIGLLLILSATFGTIRAFTGVDVYPLFDLLLAGMLIGVLASHVLGRGMQPPAIWPSVAACALFVVVTLVAIPTADTPNQGIESFRGTTWHMTVFPLLAVAGYTATVYRRIGKALVGIAALVGAYATLRWIIGPAADETLNADAWNGLFNFVGDELQLIGSFPARHNLGFWAATMVPICLAMAVAYRGRWRLAAAAGTFLCAIALLGSHVRIGIPAIALGILVVLLLSIKARAFPTLRLGTAAVTAGAIVLIGIGAYTMTRGSEPQERSSYGAILAPRGDYSWDAHREKWRELAEGIQQNPFGLGLGLGGENPQGIRGTENVYLKVAYEQGVGMALLLVVCLLAVAAALARRAVSTTDRSAAGLGIGGAAAIATAMVMFLTSDYVVGLQIAPLWIALGAGVGQLASAEVVLDQIDPEPGVVAHPG